MQERMNAYRDYMYKHSTCVLNSAVYIIVLLNSNYLSSPSVINMELYNGVSRREVIKKVVLLFRRKYR